MMSTKNCLVLDIETIGDSFEELDEISQEYMLKYAENEAEEEEIKERLGFYPLTGKIAAIGLINPDNGRGIVLVLKKEGVKLPERVDENIEIKSGTEEEILKEFWKIVEKYECIITFNGRSFDMPFIMLRSAILGVKPTKNFLSNRYVNLQKYGSLHIDLLEQLTFYGAFKRKFNLHMWAKAFGIESPKESGVTGDNVTELYNQGKLMDIVLYNVRDLKATAELYKKWRDFLVID